MNEKTPKYYLVGVAETNTAGRLVGTHHVSATQANSPEEAKDWAINDTACDWGLDDKAKEGLHVLFVMATPIGVDIDVIEYDEGAQ